MSQPVQPGKGRASREDGTAQLMRQSADLRLLRRVRELLAASDDFESIIRTAVDALAGQAGYDYVSAYLKQPDGLGLVHQVGYEHPLRWLDIESGVRGRVSRTGVAELIADVRADQDYIGNVPEIGSEICVPFGENTEAVGVLIVESPRTRTLRAGDFRIVNEIAGLLTLAIERAALARAHRTSEQRLRLALDAAAMGIWTWTVDTGAIDWQFAVSEGTDGQIGSIDDLLARAYAGDFGHLAHAFGLATSDGDLDVEFRFVGDVGEPRWLNLRGHAIDRAADGTPRVIAGVASDITGRKRLEEERLRLVHLETARLNAEAAQRTMSETIERLRDGFVAVDPELRLTLVNDEAARLFSGDRVDLLGRPLQDAVGLLGDEPAVANLVAACHSTEPSSFDVLDARAERFLEVRVFPGRDGSTLHLRDVTALRRAEYERHRIEARFRSLVQESSDLILILTSKAVIEFASPAVERMLGFQPDEIIDRRDSLTVHPADEKRFRRALIRVLRTPGTNPPFEVRVKHRDGSYRWLEVTPTNLLADPLIHGVVANCRDITERHASEFNLWLLSEISTVVGSSLDTAQTLEAVNRLLVTYVCEVSLVAVFNERGDIERHAAAEREPYRQSFGDGRQLADRAVDAIGIRSGRSFSSRHTIVVDVAHIDFDETTASYVALGGCLLQLGLTSAVVVPIVLRGQVRGVLLVGFGADAEVSPPLISMFEDVSRRAGLAIENAGLYLHARQAIEARDQFLSVAAHELRTPITSVTGYARMLLRELGDRKDPERIARYAGRLDEAGGRLATLAEDLLDVSRIRSGQLPLRVGHVDLGKLAQRVALRYAEHRSSARDRIIFSAADGVLPVMADPDRIEQVLTNLIDNALKYSPPDTRVDLILGGDEEIVRLSVRDQGIGVAPESLDAIFEPFGRAANAEETGATGLGLGLYICRTIIERLGGSIWAESEGEATGLTVIIQLPPVSKSTALATTE
jgi:PAS domain S-box-containing protein